MQLIDAAPKYEQLFTSKCSYCYPNYNSCADNSATHAPCEICGRLIVRTQLKRHIDTVHLRLKPYHCFFCDRKFGTSGQRRKHMKATHPVSFELLLLGPPHYIIKKAII